MSKTASRGVLAAMSVALFIGAQFAMVDAAHAKAAMGAAVQVPGNSGVMVINCSRQRP